MSEWGVVRGRRSVTQGSEHTHSHKKKSQKQKMLTTTDVKLADCSKYCCATWISFMCKILT